MEENKEENKKESGKRINAMALICYIGFLCLIPLLKKEKNEFVKFHMNQGLVLFGFEAITWIFVMIAPILWALGNIAGIFWLVLSIIGIMNVIKEEKKELPVIGNLVGRIKI